MRRGMAPMASPPSPLTIQKMEQRF